MLLEVNIARENEHVLYIFGKTHFYGYVVRVDRAKSMLQEYSSNRHTFNTRVYQLD